MMQSKAKELVMLDEEGPLQNPELTRKVIEFACVDGERPCHKIFVDADKGLAVCRAYLEPKAAQCRMGLTNACAIRGMGAETKVSNEKIRVGQQKQR